MSIRRSPSCAPKCLCSKTNLELQPAQTPPVPWRCTRRSSAWLGLRKISPATTHQPSPFISPARCLSILTSNKSCSRCARNRRAFLRSYAILKPFSPTCAAPRTLARRLEATGTGANPALRSTCFESPLLRIGCRRCSHDSYAGMPSGSGTGLPREGTFRRLRDCALHPRAVTSEPRRIIRKVLIPGVPIMSLPRTLGDLRNSAFSEERSRTRSVKDELRDNLIERLRSHSDAPVFPGIVGYDDTVVPQIINAILSRHNFILLGLRGQAKSRILRAMTTLLDPQLPYLAGCEIHDNPYAPICRRRREEIARLADATPIAYLAPHDRYVEKLATPDVTIADLIGDIDPIKAARGGHELGSEFTVHYGLLPRANRGIFAINELPDLAGKIQVGLFNIMQEGDVQIKGYPIRLPLDVALVFSANPEDYTARGKIITPLKDR